MRVLRWGLLLPMLALFHTAMAAVCVTDDTQRELCLKKPASRIIALSPGATELLFAAGAGEQMVGAVSFSVITLQRRKNYRGWGVTNAWVWRRCWRWNRI